MTFEGDGCPPVGRPRRSVRRIARIALPTTAALGAGAAVAIAAIPGSDGTVSFCYGTGTVGGAPAGAARIVDSTAACEQNESGVKIAQTGPQGPAGPAGAVGPAGVPGAPGTPGGGGTATITSVPVFPAAATDYLLQIDGIKGESSEKGHEGDIGVEAVSWGASHPASGGASGGGGGAGKVSFSDLTVKKPIDKASAPLLQAVATGRHLKSATLVARHLGANGPAVEFLRIKLTDVLVSSLKMSSQAPAGQGEVETVTLSFAKAEEKVSSGGATSTASWNLKAQKAR